MTKYKTWTVIQNNGDGSYSSIVFRSAQEIIDHYELPESEHSEVQDGGCPFPEGDDVPLEIQEGVFDSEGFEVVE